MGTTSGNWKEMFQAACDGDLALVQFHVESGVDVDYIHPEFMSTALVASILRQHEEVARYLLEAGADPDLLSPLDALTPREAAATSGESLRVLLTPGADAGGPKGP